MLYTAAVSSRLAFIRPLSPSRVTPPRGDDWLHEPKWDGFRFQVIKNGSDVRLHSKSGAEYTDRLRGMRDAFGKLPTQSAILDGELCLIDPRGGAHFWKLMAQMRTKWPEEDLLIFLAFDLLYQDGVDLRHLPLTERKRDLDRICRRTRNPFLRLIETFPDGEVLFDHCDRFGFEGIVSKRRAAPYASGPSRNWVKVKCPGWKRINAERRRVFETNAKPELTETPKALKKKTAELARVRERLADPNLREGLAREFRKLAAGLEREIALLERGR